MLATWTLKAILFWTSIKTPSSIRTFNLYLKLIALTSYCEFCFFNSLICLTFAYCSCVSLHAPITFFYWFEPFFMFWVLKKKEDECFGESPGMFSHDKGHAELFLCLCDFLNFPLSYLLAMLWILLNFRTYCKINSSLLYIKITWFFSASKTL